MSLLPQPPHCWDCTQLGGFLQLCQVGTQKCQIVEHGRFLKLGCSASVLLQFRAIQFPPCLLCLFYVYEGLRVCICTICMPDAHRVTPGSELPCRY